MVSCTLQKWALVEKESPLKNGSFWLFWDAKQLPLGLFVKKLTEYRVGVDFDTLQNPVINWYLVPFCQHSTIQWSLPIRLKVLCGDMVGKNEFLLVDRFSRYKYRPPSFWSTLLAYQANLHGFGCRCDQVFLLCLNLAIRSVIHWQAGYHVSSVDKASDWWGIRVR